VSLLAQGRFLARVQFNSFHAPCRYFYEEAMDYHLVLQLVEGGDLFHFLKDNFHHEQGIGIFLELFSYQLFRGLAYIHCNRVCHRDIKPENLLVNADVGTLKVLYFCTADSSVVFQVQFQDHGLWLRYHDAGKRGAHLLYRHQDLQGPGATSRLAEIYAESGHVVRYA
jgi:serine/threonine protein kinase